MGRVKATTHEKATWIDRLNARLAINLEKKYQRLENGECTSEAHNRWMQSLKRIEWLEKR